MTVVGAAWQVCQCLQGRVLTLSNSSAWVFSFPFLPLSLLVADVVQGVVRWALSHPSLFLLTSCQVLQPFVPQLGPAMGEPFPGRQRAVEGGVYQHSLRGGGQLRPRGVLAASSLSESTSVWPGKAKMQVLHHLHQPGVA